MVELRLCGLSYREIAERLGFSGVGAVRSMMLEVGGRLEREELEVGRLLHGARLDMLLASVWDRARDADADDRWKALDAALKVLDRIAKLEGLNLEKGGGGAQANVMVVGGENYVDQMKSLAANTNPPAAPTAG